MDHTTLHTPTSGPRRQHRHRRTAMALLGLALSISALGACGSSGGSSSGGEPAGTETETNYTKAADWQHDFNECLYANGIERPKASDGEGAIGSAGTDLDALAKATEVCERKVGKSPVPVDDNADASSFGNQDQALAVAACLRSEGYDVDDPKAGEPLMMPVDIPAKVQQQCNEKAGK